MSLKRLQTMQKKLRRNSTSNLRKVGHERGNSLVRSMTLPAEQVGTRMNWRAILAVGQANAATENKRRVGHESHFDFVECSSWALARRNLGASPDVFRTSSHLSLKGRQCRGLRSRCPRVPTYRRL